MCGPEKRGWARDHSTQPWSVTVWRSLGFILRVMESYPGLEKGSGRVSSASVCKWRKDRELHRGWVTWP